MTEATTTPAPAPEGTQPAPGQTPAAAPPAAVQPSPAPNPAPAPEGTPAAPERPSWLPEKFATPEDFAKSYGELEKKLSAPKPLPAHLPDPAKVTADDARQMLSGLDLDVNGLQAEFDKSGKLSDETFAKLEGKGLPREFVTQWIEGRQAATRATADVLFAAVGGPEAFRTISTWAATSAPATMLKAYNDALDSGNVELAKLALTGLQAAHVAAVGSPPNLLQGDSSAANTNGGYASQAEAVSAIRDRRYHSDPAYRAEVERKLAANPVFNARSLTRNA